MDNNKHVTAETKRAMSGILNYDILTGKTGSNPEPTGGDSQIWSQLKDVLLDPYFSPLVAKDLSNLPPAVIFTAKQDVLRDEGILYAKRLKAAGNKVEHVHSNAAFHGLLSLGFKVLNTTDAREFDEILNKALKKYL